MAGENLVRPKGLKAKIENFWYHYKYYAIACAVVVVTLLVSIAQCAAKTDYDYKVALATDTVQMTSAQIDALTSEFKEYGKVLNGDGEINFLLVDCTSSKGISDHQTYVSKQQKLQTLLMSDTEVMLFVTDAERFEWIDNLGNGNFIENTGLPHNGGKSYNLSDTGILQTAKEKIDPNEQLIWPKELYISRRTVKGTLFEGRDGVEENLKNADELVRNLIGKNTK